MPPRLNTIRTKTHAQQTPAPLLATKKGQYPNLPHQLAQRSIPPETTPLLHLPLSDWHTLNPNASLTTTELLPTLEGLPRSGKPSINTYVGNSSAITFLAPRPPSSTAFLTNTPGKSSTITTSLQSHTLSIIPEEIAALHSTLETDFVIAPSDHPPLHISPSPQQLQRRVTRLSKIAQAFLETGAKQVIASIGGGDSVNHRRESAKAAIRDGVIGYSFDGLYAGESPSTRIECIKVAIDELPEKGLRLLPGGSGAPWEVINAVREGIDVVDGDYPFERASSGQATNLETGAIINVRDRKWETCKGVLAHGCGCFVCVQGFSKGYMRHLFEVHEIMAVSFLAAHNLWDYLSWFERLRDAVRGGVFEDFVDAFERNREGVRVGNF